MKNRKNRLFTNMLMLACCLFMLTGCGSVFGPLPDPSAEAQAYLENKYDTGFEVKEFSRKDTGGPFLEQEYSGTACCLEEPALCFDIWAARDLSAFHDNYYAVNIMNEMDIWLKECGRDIWDDFRVRGQVRILDSRLAPAYEGKDLDDFLQSEFVRCSIFLYLREGEEGIVNKMYSYMQEIKTAKNGILYVYVLDDDDFKKLDVYEPEIEDALKCQTSITLGAGKQSVINACAGLDEKADASAGTKETIKKEKKNGS